MNKKIIAALSALTMFSSSALAQATCDAGKLSALFDTYAGNPFSARTWRVLNRLGDPMIEPSGSGSDTWVNQDNWKKLAAGILPAGHATPEVGYDCRIGYPLQVLQSRISTLGKENPYVLQWLKVQQKVLQVCNHPNTTDTELPEPIDVDPAHPTMQAEDRAYQEATVAFYADKPKAIELFRAIANTDSPHKAAARYNIANLLANSKDVVAARTEANAILGDPALSSVHGITQELLGYIANLEDTPAGWTALIDESVEVIAAPTKDILASDKLKADYGRALNDIDYAGIRGKRDDWWLTGTLPADATISKAIFDASRKHPIALWMMSGQTVQENYDRAPWSLVGDKWQAWTTGYLDQALAVTSGAQMPALPRDVLGSLKAKPGDATREVLWAKAHAALAAAQKSCGEAAETAALGTYLTQAVRVSAATGHFDEIYTELGKLPFKTSSHYYGVVQKLGGFILGQGQVEEGRKMRDKLLTPEFLAAIPSNMKPGVTDRLAEFMGWVAEDEGHWKTALALHSQKTANPILNFLPDKALWTLADDPMFSNDQKALLTRAAWTRGYARGGTPTADETDKLYAANPKLKETADKIAAEFPKLSVERQRLLTVLRNPRLGILVNAPDLWSSLDVAPDDFTDVSSGDRNDRNWWCPLETDRQLAGLRNAFNYGSGIDSVDEYAKGDLTQVFDQAVRDGLDKNREALLKQHPMIKAVNWKEVEALSNMPSAPRLLTQSAIGWSKASKGADGAPEALALAVRTTRYGCSWHGRHRAYSRPAQQLLGTKFPETRWAKETRYWFDCQRMEWDKGNKNNNKVAVCDAKTWPKQALPR